MIHLSGKVEGVDGFQAGVHLLEGGGIDEVGDAVAGGKRVVVVALGADVQVLLELELMDHAAALRAFGPEALGHVGLFGAERFEAVLFEDGHRR